MKNQQAATVLRELSPARIFARPTADDLWLGPTQASALSQLFRPVPVRALLGPHSSGRSTLLTHLAAQLAGTATVLSVSGPERLRSRVLKMLLESAGIGTDGLSRSSMRKLLHVCIRERIADGRRIVILVDRSDRIGPAAFGELSRLRELAAAAPAGPELVLSLEHIDESSSAAADFLRQQSVPELVVLSWMNTTELSWYLNWRLERFGLGGLFTPAAVRLVARCTKGCYAAVDHLCQLALLLLRNGSGSQIDVVLVREAFRMLGRQHRQRQPDAGDSEQIRLLVSRDGKILHELSCKERLLIGRSHFNDLCLESSYLSRHHMAIDRGASGFYASDLNSVNGVVLNGRSIQTAPIGHGDVICLGPYRIKVELSADIRRPGDDTQAVNLDETLEMPAPRFPEPAHLKLVK